MSDFRALDQDGDWTFGKGQQDYVVGQGAVVLDITTALKTFLGECFFALDFGIDWWNLLGNRSEQGIILQSRAMIAKRPEVTRINAVTASLNRTTRQLQVTFNINTVYTRNTTATVAVP